MKAPLLIPVNGIEAIPESSSILMSGTGSIWGTSLIALTTTMSVLLCNEIPSEIHTLILEKGFYNMP